MCLAEPSYHINCHPGLHQHHQCLATHQHMPLKESPLWIVVATGHVMWWDHQRSTALLPLDKGRKDCCITRNGLAEDMASRPVGPWNTWRLVYHFTYWQAGSHNKLQRARVQLKAYKKGRLKRCNLRDEGCFEVGHTHLAQSTLRKAALISPWMH